MLDQQANYPQPGIGTESFQHPGKVLVAFVSRASRLHNSNIIEIQMIVKRNVSRQGHGAILPTSEGSICPAGFGHSLPF